MFRRLLRRIFKPRAKKISKKQIKFNDGVIGGKKIITTQSGDGTNNHKSSKITNNDITKQVNELRRQYGKSYIDFTSNSQAVSRMRERIAEYSRRTYTKTAKAEFVIMSHMNSTLAKQLQRKNISDEDVKRLMNNFTKTTFLYTSPTKTLHAFIMQDTTSATFSSDVVEFEEVDKGETGDIEQFLDSVASIFNRG